MSLLTEWREHAYSLDDRTPEGKEFWLDYFQREKAIYEKILENPVEIEGGTVKELADDRISGWYRGQSDRAKQGR